MAKDSSWKGVADATPSTEPKGETMDNQYKRNTENYDWKGIQDSTPKSDTKSASVKINGGSED